MKSNKFGAPLCPVCNGRVYFAEEARAMGKSFHRSCFKCEICHKTLDSFTVNDHEGALYCKTCYAKNFGPNVYGHTGSVGFGAYASLEKAASTICRSSQSAMDGAFYDGDYSDSRTPNNNVEYYGQQANSMSSASTNSLHRSSYPVYARNDYSPNRMYRPRARFNSSQGLLDNQCANCPDPVFANERIDAVGKVFHRLCFRCTSCRRMLDRGSACDHEYNVYCQNCYTKNFGSTGLKAGTNLRCE